MPLESSKSLLQSSEKGAVCEATVDKRRDIRLIMHHPASPRSEGGRFPVDWVAGFPWTGWQKSVEYASCVCVSHPDRENIRSTALKHLPILHLAELPLPKKQRFRAVGLTLPGKASVMLELWHTFLLSHGSEPG
jgi:hypothetical protein